MGKADYSNSTPLKKFGLFSLSARLFAGMGLSAFFIFLAIVVPLWPITAPLFLLLAVGAPFVFLRYRARGNCPICSEYIEVTKRKGGIRCCGCKQSLVIRDMQLWAIDDQLRFGQAQPVVASSRSRTYGFGRLRISLAGVIGLILLALIVSLGRSPAENQHKAANSSTVSHATIAADSPSRSSTNKQPAGEERDSPDQGRKDELETAKNADVAQDELEAAEKAEQDAERKLMLARSMMSGNKKAADERLRQIIAMYAGTDAADDAKELLAGRAPKPRERQTQTDRSGSSQRQADDSRADSALRVQVVSNKLVDFVSPTNGQKLQMLMVTLKNTGSTPIRVVDADITARDSSGKIVCTTNYTIFAEFDSSSGLAPGRTWTTRKGEGFILQWGAKATKADVRITNVREHAASK